MTGLQLRRTPRSGAWLLCVVFALVGACTREQAAQTDSNHSSGSAAQGAVIGDDLMLALAQAKNYHHKANVYIADGNTAEAIASVRQILALRFPANAPEADDVRHDARALLAKLLASQGKLEDAMAVIAEGLASATRESFFVANMYTVKGELHQARAELLSKDAARKTDADAERRAAIMAFDRSIEINTRLQQQLESQHR